MPDCRRKMPNRKAVSTFDMPSTNLRISGSQPGLTSKMLRTSRLSAFGENEHRRREWSEAEEERAAIVEYGGGIPRTWVEGFARLDPDHSRQMYGRDAGCGSSTISAASSIAASAPSLWRWDEGRSTCSAATATGRSPASIKLGSYGY
jgi:hypothetical protein